MPCLNPDGSLTESARTLLKAAAKPVTPEELSSQIGQPLFKVRSRLREMTAAGLLEQTGESYRTTAKGIQQAEKAA